MSLLRNSFRKSLNITQTPQTPQISQSPMSPGKVISNIQTEIVKHKKNDLLTFLILLHQKDYQKGLLQRSVYEKLISNYDLFPGNLIIVNYNDFQKDEYKYKYFIEGNVIPKQVYLKLPKEDLFVPVGTFQEKYLNSRINELINIFSNLKPKKIIVSVDKDNQELFELNTNIGGITPIGDVRIGGEINKELESELRIIKYMEFNLDSKPVDPNYFKNEYKFYYLPKEEEWLELIRKRLKHKLTKEKYIYSYKDMTKFKTSLTTKLQVLDIEINYNQKKYDNLKIYYEVEYYPLDDNFVPINLNS